MSENRVAEYTVDIIASGYEFMCPDCDAYNTIIQTATEVECGACKHLFDVGGIEHAIGSGREIGALRG